MLGDSNEKQVMFAVRKYQLATSAPIGCHVREHSRLQPSPCILQTFHDGTSFCFADWLRESQYQ